MTDIWTVLLAIGILVSFVCTVAMIVGLAPAKRPTAERVRVPQRSPLDIGSAGAVRERAATRARAAAAAAPTAKHVLTEVRVVPAEHDVPSGAAAGQRGPLGDGPLAEGVIRPEDARAIVDHFAEHDPRRVAEVITQWIRSDLNPPSDRP